MGDSGTGKTTMALAVAATIQAEVHHIASRSCDLDTVQRICQACYYAPMFGSKWKVVLVDEADKMSQPAQLAFLSKLDSTEAPPDTIFIFTANGTRLLEDRFLSRCRKIRFTTEGLAQPGAELLMRIWTAEAGARPAPEFQRILESARYNVREALNLLELEILAPGSFADQMAPIPTPIVPRAPGASTPRQPQPHTPYPSEHPADWPTWGAGRKAAWTRRSRDAMRRLAATA